MRENLGDLPLDSERADAALPIAVLDRELLPGTRATLHPRDGGDVLTVVPDESGEVLVGDSPPDTDWWLDTRGPSLRRRSASGWATLVTHARPNGSATLSRNQGILDVGRLQRARVAIVGLGSGGSVIADALARCGVGQLLLIDNDRIEASNIGRHLCGASDLGRKKTNAVRDAVLNRNSSTRVEVLDADVVVEHDRFIAASAGVDVFVGATDNNASRRVVNACAVATGTPAVFGRVWERGCGGDVIVYRSGGPCYECLFSSVVEESTAPARNAHLAYGDRPDAPQPGLFLDIQAIASLCARVVLQELVRGDPGPLAPLNEDLSAPMFLWCNRREGPFAAWSPMDGRCDRMAALRWYAVRAPRRPACPACDPSTFLTRLAAMEKPDA